MNNICKTLCATAVAAKILGTMLGNHFVHTDAGILLLPKQRPVVTDTFADVRQWEEIDEVEHPDLAAAVLASVR